MTECVKLIHSRVILTLTLQVKVQIKLNLKIELDVIVNLPTIHYNRELRANLIKTLIFLVTNQEVKLFKGLHRTLKTLNKENQEPLLVQM